MLIRSKRLDIEQAVSELTYYWRDHLCGLFLDQSLQTIVINLSIKVGDGSLNDYYLSLEPMLDNNRQLVALKVLLCQQSFTDALDPETAAVLLLINMERYSMTISQLYKCALHVSGDYLKFILSKGV